jgi:hypothetical protein
MGIASACGSLTTASLYPGIERITQSDRFALKARDDRSALRRALHYPLIFLHVYFLE